MIFCCYKQSHGKPNSCQGRRQCFALGNWSRKIWCKFALAPTRLSTKLSKNNRCMQKKYELCGAFRRDVMTTTVPWEWDPLPSCLCSFMRMCKNNVERCLFVSCILLPEVNATCAPTILECLWHARSCTQGHPASRQLKHIFTALAAHFNSTWYMSAYRHCRTMRK